MLRSLVDISSFMFISYFCKELSRSDRASEFRSRS